MAMLTATRCRKCDKVFQDVWSDEDNPVCCKRRTKWFPMIGKSPEWGGPRLYKHIREEPFGSRSELAQYAKDNHMALGASSEKHGGARNEEYLNLGRTYSYVGSPKG